MNTEERKAVAKRVSQYLRFYSKARHFLLVDDISNDLSRTFISTDGETFVTSNKSYLLYKCESKEPSAFISLESKIEQKKYVARRKHVPTFVMQRSYFNTAINVDALVQKISSEFYEIEDENLDKLVQIAFNLSSNKRNTIRSKSLKDALEEANDLLKQRVRLIDAIGNANDLIISRVSPNLRYNVLSNVSLNLSDINDEIVTDKKSLGLIYKNNKIFTSSKIPGNTLFVMPTPEHLGVMPIVEDITLFLDKHSMIAYYEVGMSILNPNNIIKIELEY